MSTKARIRTYNVGFGDCFLVSIPEATRTRHMLVDFGNAIGKGGANAPFPAVAENIEAETGGRLDVVVVTHEHADHMEGIYHQRKVFNRMQIDNVWMSMSSAPDYYDAYPNAQPQKKMKAFVERFHNAAAARKLSLAPSFEALVRNNLSNADRLRYIRDELADTVWYVSRGADMRGTGLGNIKVKILAPEDDTSVYYSGGGNHLTGRLSAVEQAFDDSSNGVWTFPAAKRAPGGTPTNLSTSEWNRLRSRIQNEGVEMMRSIDRAANNTSLVFTVEVSGRKLLFTGDAEVESWKTMAKKKQIRPVDFLKVSHHGSHNGTPLGHLDDLLPQKTPKTAVVVVSTQSKVYGTKNPVPDKKLLGKLKGRAKTLKSTDGASKPWFDVFV